MTSYTFAQSLSRIRFIESIRENCFDFILMAGNYNEHDLLINGKNITSQKATILSLLHADDRSHNEGGEPIARADLLHDERPPGRRLAVRGKMQPKALTLVERSGEEIKQPHLVRTDVTGCNYIFESCEVSG